MSKQKSIILLLLILFASTLETKRRKRIIDEYDYKPVRLLAQNEPPEDKGEEKEEEELLEEEEGEEVEAEAEGEIEEAKKKEAEEEYEEEEGEEEEEEKPTVEKKEEEPEKPEEPEEEVKDIFLNFDNADLKTFADYIGNLKKINVITDPKIAGNKISLTIRDPLTVEGAWNIFLTVLEMSKFSIVKVGEVYKIIPQGQKKTEPLPTYINVGADGIPSEKLPDSDVTIRYVTILTNIPINQVQGLLKSMLSPGHSLIPHQNSNGFVITDKSYNIKAAMKVIQELDRSDVKQSVIVMRLKNADAKDVTDLFNSLRVKKEQHPLARLLGRKQEKTLEFFSPTTKIVEEPRTNSLILIGDLKSIERIQDFIVKYVDTELKGIESPIHIYELKHADAPKIKQILNTMVNQTQSTSEAAKYGGIRGGLKYLKKMKFAVDKTGNRLLVSSTSKQDWKLLKKIIEELDKPQPQVALETLIVSIDFTNSKELGAQIRNKKHGQLGSNIDYQTTHITAPPATATENGATTLLGNLLSKATFELGSTILTFGKSTNVWALLRMLKSQVNTSVISKPFIVTTNMKPAEIRIGEQRRVAMQQAASDTGNPGNLTGYTPVDANLSLNVTPQINLDGIISLDITIEIDEFAESGATDRPDIIKKKVQTNASVANGQVLVLGGFIKTKIEEALYKTPVLGSIPIFGWLFKNKQRVVRKEYIFMFISPTIVKPRQKPGVNLYTKMKLYQAKQDIDDAIEVRTTKDPIHNWFFNGDKETYSHKIIDYANARYQPASVDIEEDEYYRAVPLRKEDEYEKKEKEREEKRKREAPPKVVDVERGKPPEEPPDEEEPPPEDVEEEVLEEPEKKVAEKEVSDEEPDEEELLDEDDEEEDPEDEEVEKEEKLEAMSDRKRTRELRRKQLRELLSPPSRVSTRESRRRRLKKFLAARSKRETTP